MEETQVMPIGESDTMVDWNCLRISDLKLMCLRYNIASEGMKADIINRLETFWKKSNERDSELLRVEKEKLDNEMQKQAILTYIEKRLKRKIDKKLENSLLKVLDKNLQQWSKVNTIESFPKKTFKNYKTKVESNKEGGHNTFLPEYFAGVRGGKLLHPEIEELSKLCLFSSAFNTKGPLLYKKLQSKYNDSSSAMDINKVVATTFGTKLDCTCAARTKDHFRTRSIRVCRTLEKPKMKIFGYTYSSVEKLSEEARILAKNLVSPFYRARLDKY
ncbi:6557_t:CDS:2 [Racocetra fulgida]|uniref:6557_t:CDS:1 n=1 Tax=Racocetra fulgida TaxID=60492 RepID=A0A9N8VLV8_9GLOM|nr:6557_t:CDS:2 [Racocetra fulgida]